MRIFKRGRYWWIDFTYHGRRYRFSLKTTMKSVAKAVMRDIQRKIVAEEFSLPWQTESIIFDDFVTEYLKHSQMHKTPAGFALEKVIIRHLLEHFSGKPLEAIRPEDIEHYKMKRLKKVKPATLNRELRVLRALLNKAVQWGHIDESPFKYVKLLKEPPGRIRYLSTDELRRLLAVLGDGHLRTIVLIALNTGMRKGEILSLRWKDIDFERRLIILKQTKTNQLRIVPMNDIVYHALLAAKPKNAHPQDRVFQIKSFKRSWKTALKKAGIHDFRFHDLRHTFASYLVMKGIDLRTVSELLGHRTLKMVYRYSHLNEERLRVATNTLGTILAHSANLDKLESDKSERGSD